MYKCYLKQHSIFFACITKQDYFQYAHWDCCASPKTVRFYERKLTFKTNVQCLRLNRGLLLCLGFCNFDLVILKVILSHSWKTNLKKGLNFRRYQDYSCSLKSSRIVAILFWACHFQACVKNIGDPREGNGLLVFRTLVILGRGTDSLCSEHWWSSGRERTPCLACH